MILPKKGRKAASRKRKAGAEKRIEAQRGLGEVMAVVARLRAKDGCPWDREQTHVSLKPALLEETYELLEAIEKGDPKELAEELGDLLLQVVFHYQIAAEARRFTLRDVIVGLKHKLIRRHPHVFAEPRLADANAVLRQRASIKAKEKKASRLPSTSLGDLPRAMPALARAQRITERASHLGFDWPRIEPVWEKVEEEIRELKSAYSTGDKRRLKEESGDLLFALVNLARFLDLDAEDALAMASDRFVTRFSHIETRLRQKGKSPAESSLAEMDALSEQPKKIKHEP